LRQPEILLLRDIAELRSMLLVPELCTESDGLWIA
jgi:hypothetical protein